MSKNSKKKDAKTSKQAAKVTASQKKAVAAVKGKKAELVVEDPQLSLTSSVKGKAGKKSKAAEPDAPADGGNVGVAHPDWNIKGMTEQVHRILEAARAAGINPTPEEAGLVISANDELVGVPGEVSTFERAELIQDGALAVGDEILVSKKGKKSKKHAADDVDPNPWLLPGELEPEPEPAKTVAAPKAPAPASTGRVRLTENDRAIINAHDLANTPNAKGKLKPVTLELPVLYRTKNMPEKIATKFRSAPYEYNISAVNADGEYVEAEDKWRVSLVIEPDTQPGD